MKAKLYGIGAGPGDPDLLTLKAIRVIRECDVIAIPKSGTSQSIVFSIVEEYVKEKVLFECSFSMSKDLAKRKEARGFATERIIEYLDKGLHVGFVTLGDPTTYSTYIYVHQMIVERGYEAEIIPGISSYSAAAAAFGTALCEDDEILTIVPGRHKENMEALLDYPGNKVIMKSGESLSLVLEQLKKSGLANQTKIASHVTMPHQRLFHSIEEYEQAGEAGYLTLALVKASSGGES